MGGCPRDADADGNRDADEVEHLAADQNTAADQNAAGLHAAANRGGQTHQDAAVAANKHRNPHGNPVATAGPNRAWQYPDAGRTHQDAAALGDTDRKTHTNTAPAD